MLTLVSACKDDNEEDLNLQPQPQCDTNNIIYSSQESAILAANCYSCHSTDIASGIIVRIVSADNRNRYCATKGIHYYGVKVHVIARRRAGKLPVPEFIGINRAYDHD